MSVKKVMNAPRGDDGAGAEASGSEASDDTFVAWEPGEGSREGGDVPATDGCAADDANAEPEEEERTMGMRSEDVTEEEEEGAEECVAARAVAVLETSGDGHGEGEDGDGGTEDELHLCRRKAILIAQGRHESAPSINTAEAEEDEDGAKENEKFTEHVGLLVRCYAAREIPRTAGLW